MRSGGVLVVALALVAVVLASSAPLLVRGQEDPQPSTRRNNPSLVDCFTFYTNDLCTRERSAQTVGRELQSTYCLGDRDTCSPAPDYLESYRFHCAVGLNATEFFLWSSVTTCEGTPDVNITIVPGECTPIGHENLFVLLSCDQPPPDSETQLFLNSLGLYSAIGIGLVLLFSVIQRSFRSLYQVRNVLDAKAGNEVMHPLRGFFGWITTTLELGDDEVFERCGLDCAMYVILFRKLFKAFFYCSIFTISVLVPCTIHGGSNRRGIESINASNLPAGSNFFVVHAFNLMIYSIAIVWALEKSYKRYIRFRTKYLAKGGPETQGILVRDIPAHIHGEDGVAEYFRSMYPDVLGVARVVDTKALAEIIKKRTKYKKLHERSRYHIDQGKNKQVRINARLGCFGGEKVNALNHYDERLQEYNIKYVEEKAHVRNSPTYQSSACVLFETPKSALIAAQVVHCGAAYRWSVDALPEPGDIEWQNVGMDHRVRSVRELIVTAATITLMIFWTVPVSFVSGFLTLTSLQHFFPFLRDETPDSTFGWFIEWVLPPLILLIFTSLLPPIMRFFTFHEGKYSSSLIERGMLVKLFWFQIVNVFIVSLVLGSIIPIINDIRDNPAQIISLIGNSVPNTGYFFTSYVMLKAFFDYPQKLFRFVEVAILFAKVKILSVTPKEAEELQEPEPFSVPEEFAEDTLVILIAITFSTINPIVVPFALVYFAIVHLFNKYEMFFIRKQKYDGGGILWHIMFHQIMTCLMIAQATVISVFIVRRAEAAAIMTVVVMILTAVAWRYISRGVGDVGARLPLEEVAKRPSVSREELIYSFHQPEVREDDTLSIAPEDLLEHANTLQPDDDWIGKRLLHFTQVDRLANVPIPIIGGGRTLGNLRGVNLSRESKDSSPGNNNNNATTAVSSCLDTEEQSFMTKSHDNDEERPVSDEDNDEEGQAHGSGSGQQKLRFGGIFSRKNGGGDNNNKKKKKKQPPSRSLSSEFQSDHHYVLYKNIAHPDHADNNLVGAESAFDEEDGRKGETLPAPNDGERPSGSESHLPEHDYDELGLKEGLDKEYVSKI